MSAPREALLVFLRVPEPGRAKTRLIPALGPDGAASLYRRVAERVLDAARALERPALERLVFVSPDEGVADVAPWAGPGCVLLPQGRGDLGDRMSAAFDTAFARGAGRALIIGTDCLDLDEHVMSRAFDALDENDVVLGPAIDGGYYLLGLRGARLEVFDGVPWSSPETLAATRAALKGSGASWTELETLRDLDDPDDLEALRKRFPEIL